MANSSFSPSPPHAKNEKQKNKKATSTMKQQQQQQTTKAVAAVAVRPISGKSKLRKMGALECPPVPHDIVYEEGDNNKVIQPY